MRKFLRSVLVAIALVSTADPATAQLRGIKAELTPLVESDGVHPGTTLRAALQVQLPRGFHVQSNKPRDPSLIPTDLAIDVPAGVTVEEIVFPEPTDLVQLGQPQPLAVFPQNFAIGVRFAVSGDVPQGELAVPARLRYQACDDTTCFAPTNADLQWTVRVVPAAVRVKPEHADVMARIAFGRVEKPAARAAVVIPRELVPSSPAAASDVAALDDFDVVATTGGYQGSNDFLKFIQNAENGVKEPGLFEGRGPLAILLIVFLGGLALNLTPCVLPMIPINLAIIGAGTQAGSRTRGLLLGAVYGAAMAVVYGLLGLVVILTAGTFGTINSSPWFNLAIAVLFVALALAMFDVITIDFSRFSGLGSGRLQPAEGPPAGGYRTYLIAFSMGAIAALLAGACVAPVVIQVVLFSSNLYATGTTIALALPFFLGVGMAVPWPLAGAGLAALPKPGAWMVRVKQALGAIIFATAAYYAYEAYGLFSDRWVDSTAVTSSVQEKLKEGWYPSLGEGLAAAKHDRKPVLVDLWATWCKNCLTMDMTTLKDPAVKSALDGYVKIKFRAEQPDEQPAQAVMKRFDAVGLPAYAILQPKN